MKKLIFLAIFSLPLLGFSQIEKSNILKLEIPKTDFPKIDFSKEFMPINSKNFIVTVSPAPWNMPIAKIKNADLYKILVAKPIENLEKILVAKPKE